MPILVDTGDLIAVIDGSDVDHDDAAAVFELYAGRLVVPSTVEETSWQLDNNISAPDDD